MKPSPARPMPKRAKVYNIWGQVFNICNIWGHNIWGQVLYFAAIRNRHADCGAWMTAAHDTHGYTLSEIAATVGLQDTRPDPYFSKIQDLTPIFLTPIFQTGVCP